MFEKACPLYEIVSLPSLPRFNAPCCHLMPTGNYIGHRLLFERRKRHQTKHNIIVFDRAIAGSVGVNCLAAGWLVNKIVARGVDTVVVFVMYAA